ncbi:hypothetical protein YE105_C0227 [Yersinia enterocolitica subsp. palearctica 105.5R(r)]|uniref:Uncharacterized protein n=1 Tax=Yersinia enterocolitica W22703 TaxID=913028 RepID=F4N3V0_YEREN|nr:hypothetical protein YE105_C0227 [Yersinia enterocolitica subsp. palearctica 105.5R(r)]CBX72758.1 unknown protein [Yersinia enterocolitica W22703]
MHSILAAGGFIDRINSAIISFLKNKPNKVLNTISNKNRLVLLFLY